MHVITYSRTVSAVVVSERLYFTTHAALFRILPNCFSPMERNGTDQIDGEGNLNRIFIKESGHDGDTYDSSLHNNIIYRAYVDRHACRLAMRYQGWGEVATVFYKFGVSALCVYLLL